MRSFGCEDNWMKWPLEGVGVFLSECSVSTVSAWLNFVGVSITEAIVTEVCGQSPRSSWRTVLEMTIASTWIMSVPIGTGVFLGNQSRASIPCYLLSPLPPFTILFLLWHLYLFYASDSWLQFIFIISPVFFSKICLCLLEFLYLWLFSKKKKKQKDRSASTMYSISSVDAYGISTVFNCL